MYIVKLYMFHNHSKINLSKIHVHCKTGSCFYYRKMNVDEHVKLCDEQAYKNARLAWQIKGHMTTDSNRSQGEPSCHRSGSGVPEPRKYCHHGNKNSIDCFDCTEIGLETEPQIQNTDSDSDEAAVGKTVCSVVYSENMLADTSVQGTNFNTGTTMNPVDNKEGSKYLDEVDSESASNTLKVDALSSIKRKCSAQATETNQSSVKRVKLGNIDASNSSPNNNFVTRQSGASNICLERPVVNSHFVNIPTRTLPQLRESPSAGFDVPSFIWQKQEMGCAIVDNVFNRTLEEMGLSPDPVVNLTATTRLTVENDSIETAIRSQGLRTNTSHHRILMSDMEELRHNATMEDFQHTQNQLSRIMADVQPVRNDDPNVTPYNTLNSVTITKENYNCDEAKSELVHCSSSNVVNNLDTNDDLTPAVADDIMRNDMGADEKIVGMENRCETSVSAADHADSVVMEYCENTQYETLAERDSENVLDLAVSAAILNQGLTFDAVQ